MTKKEITTTKKERLKMKWKELLVALLGVIGIVYFILTGVEIDFSSIIGFLG